MGTSDRWLLSPRLRGCLSSLGLLACYGCARGLTQDVETVEAGIAAREDDAGGASSDARIDGPIDSGMAEVPAEPGTDTPDAAVDPDEADSGVGASICEVGGADCKGARDFGELSGDRRSSDNWTEISGQGSDWVRVRVREDRSTAHSLHAQARLEVPANSNYDVYMYRSDTPDTPSCTNAVDSSAEGPGRAEEVSHSWDYESVLGNGDNDSRIVTIEVRHVGGACEPWKLRVQGPL